MVKLLMTLIAMVTTAHGHPSPYRLEPRRSPFECSCRRQHPLHGSSYRLGVQQVSPPARASGGTSSTPTLLPLGGSKVTTFYSLGKTSTPLQLGHLGMTQLVWGVEDLFYRTRSLLVSLLETSGSACLVSTLERQTTLQQILASRVS